MTKAIKEIAIMLLVCLVTMLILAIALYKYIPNKKNVPEINKYVASEQVKDLLEDDIDTRSDNKKVLLTYEETTSRDLRGYQTTNDYVPGKTNPFATYSRNVEGEPENTSTTSSETRESKISEQTEKVDSSTPSVYENTGTK